MDGSLSEHDLFEIGKKYIYENFINKDKDGKHSPFCLTHDGFLVEYLAKNTHHFLDMEFKTDGKKKSLIERVERVHWVIPVLRGTANTHTYISDGTNSVSGDFRRIYYAKSLNYVIILNLYDPGIFRLNTAYPVTEKETRHQMQRLFGV